MDLEPAERKYQEEWNVIPAVTWGIHFYSWSPNDPWMPHYTLFVYEAHKKLSMIIWRSEPPAVLVHEYSEQAHKYKNNRSCHIDSSSNCQTVIKTLLVSYWKSKLFQSLFLFVQTRQLNSLKLNLIFTTQTQSRLFFTTNLLKCSTLHQIALECNVAHHS